MARQQPDKKDLDASTERLDNTKPTTKKQEPSTQNTDNYGSQIFFEEIVQEKKWLTTATYADQKASILMGNF